jgi:hypothetical protein
MAYWAGPPVCRNQPALMTAILAPPAARQPRPETNHDAARTPAAADRTFGNFDEARRCMDDLFLAQGKGHIDFTTAGIPDATGSDAADSTGIFISAVSHISAKRGASRFVNHDPTHLNVQAAEMLP